MTGSYISTLSSKKADKDENKAVQPMRMSIERSDSLVKSCWRRESYRYTLWHYYLFGLHHHKLRPLRILLCNLFHFHSLCELWEKQADSYCLVYREQQLT